jgi:hypothetical protein
MKKNQPGCLASILLTAMFSLCLNSTLTAEPAPPTDGHTTFTINFFNPGDHPPTPPYMSMTFRDLSAETEKAVTQLRDEMDTALRNQGGVVHDEDYIRILEVLPVYIIRLRELGVPSTRISLPRIRIGMVLYQE